MSLLPSATYCCDPCDEPLTVAVPGPAGADGAAGAAGTNGVNAYTTTSADFTMPAQLANVTIDVVASSPFSVNQIVYVRAGGGNGYFQVISKPSSTQLQLKNLRDDATSAYAANATAGVSFASGAQVSPGGYQGPTGATGAAGSSGAVLSGSGSPEGVTTGTGVQFYWDLTNKVLYIHDTVATSNTGWRELIA